MNSVGIKGMGYYVPENVVTNFDLEKIVDTTDEWIRTRTGIEERRFASPDEATSDLSYKAALKAIEVAKIDKNQIDMIIVATCTPDYIAQGTSCLVQNKLGLTSIPCLDVNAACSGFIYGMSMAYSLVKSKIYKNILVVGAETLSRIIDMQDRNTCVLFGDGAGAVIIGEVEEGYGILGLSLGAEGEDDMILKVPAGGTRKPNNEETIKNRENFLIMKGKEVFKFAVTVLPKVTLNALEQSKLSVNDLSMIFPHQANERIIEAASKRIEFPLEKFYMNLNRFGNTSAASIAIALGEALEKGLVKKGDNIALTGFGAGLTYGSMVMKWAY
nr:beta-ketoacyl-ACP synthase III [uncultured Fusobacterium sp.]